MRNFVLLLLFAVIGTIPVLAQDIRNLPRKWKRDTLEYKIPRIDTLKYTNGHTFKNQLQNKSNPVDIPNFYAQKQDSSQFVNSILVKKLSGKGSVKMPGTEKLDATEGSPSMKLIKPDSMTKAQPKK